MKPQVCLLPLLFMVAACSSLGGLSGPTTYRCEHGIHFRVFFADDSAQLETVGTDGRELLFRDAGGQGPQQVMYSNTRMRAEFGLGAGGREARLTVPQLPLTARCVRD